MFDYHAMPTDWPGRAEAPAWPHEERAPHVENALAASVAQRMGNGFREERFMPYVQMHEFEAVLFSDVHTLAELLATQSGAVTSGLADRLGEIVSAAGGLEAVNDGPNTAPQKTHPHACAGIPKTDARRDRSPTHWSGRHARRMPPFQPMGGTY